MNNLRSPSPKVVADPIVVKGPIDISEVLPIVDTRAFQALSDKRQLGMTYLVFRAANHSRFQHCLGTYHVTKKLAARWLEQGSIDKESAKAAPVYGLIHDIGQFAFSHVTETFCELDDDEMTEVLIQEELRPAIEACGVNVELVESMAAHENPLYLMVHDKNLGMEKLDYLERDGWATDLGPPNGINYLREHIYFVENTVAIDEKVVDHTIDTLEFYMKMYKEVYFRKALVIAQRMFHTIVSHLILNRELSPKDLPRMTDSELIGLMTFSDDDVVSSMYTRLRERDLFREALVIRPENLVDETRLSGKDINVVGVTPEEMRSLIESPQLQTSAHGKLEELQFEIAEISGIPEDEILVVPVFNPERFKAKDVSIYGSDGELHSLRERRPEHFDSMEATARNYAALRICTSPKWRKKLSDKSLGKDILDHVLSSSNDPT